ncbi:MAG TPA: 4-hydroxy-tetrahydrodipicolinate synthase [Bacteroidota bacterium]|nr:4-hydroxy-tetrahydrodipicolinate synthase [Bacteroidota bacterium]
MRMKRKKKFQGTATALVTPFRQDGSLDESTLRKLVDWQIASGVEGLVPCGTTGENPTLSDNEHRRVVEVVIEQTRGRAVVIAGAGSNDTNKAIKLAKFAEEAGADYALVVGPYYNKPTQEGYYQHFKAVADAVEIPIIIYNVPGRTGGNIEPTTVLRLAERVENIVGVKEASGNIGQIMEIARRKPAHFSLLSGDDAITLPLMAVGGDGCISVAANEVPKEFSDLVRLCLKGKWKKALTIHNKLLDLMNVNFIESNPIPVKAALAMMGRISEVYRLPLVPLSDKNREKLKSVLSELDLIEVTQK